MTDETLPPRPLLDEIALARLDDDFIGFWANGIRNNTDPILKGRGGDLRLYDQVRDDPQVISSMQQRISALVSRPWRVIAGAEDARSEAAAEEAEAQLKLLDWDQITRLMLWGVFYGYSVGEIMWSGEGGKISFADVKVRRARRFGFDGDGRLMLRAVMGRPETLMPEGKFWCMSALADTSDEPYGLGLAHYLYWLVYFKKMGMKAWMIALDRHASPTVYGKFPPGTPEPDQRKLLYALKRLKDDAAIVYPEGMEIGLLQASKSVSVDYAVFQDRMDAWISKICLSQTMTTDDGSSRSQSETHKTVRDEVIAADADLLCGSFNRGPLRWWTEWNYGEGVVPPKLIRVMEDEEDQDAAADRDVKLHSLGWVPNEDRIQRVYGEDYERAPAQSVPAAPPAIGEDGRPLQFAEHDQDAIGSFVDLLMASGAAPGAAVDIIQPIAEALEGATDFEEFRARLSEISFSDEALSPMQELLAQAMFMGRVAGEVAAPLRDGQELETP